MGGSITRNAGVCTLVAQGVAMTRPQRGKAPPPSRFKAGR
jgi:hypothetical protein